MRACPRRQVINFYMEMLQERSTQLCECFPARPQSHFFSSFFLNKLLQLDGKNAYNYEDVSRWSKRFDTFAQDKIVFPVRVCVCQGRADDDIACLHRISYLPITPSR